MLGKNTVEEEPKGLTTLAKISLSDSILSQINITYFLMVYFNLMIHLDGWEILTDSGSIHYFNK
jgi:hypothetical protein